MSSDINDLTVQYEEEGVVTVKELEKVILLGHGMLFFFIRFLAKTLLDSNCVAAVVGPKIGRPEPSK